ncbi:hypothetical protein AOLI_G00256750 [Acnodon oligacanthus]
MILEPERSQPCTTGHEDGPSTGEENADQHQKRRFAPNSGNFSRVAVNYQNNLGARGPFSDLTLGYR